MRNFLCLCLLSLSLSSSSQYHPLLQDDKVWQLGIYYSESYNQITHSATWHIVSYIKGDTLIDTTTYKKLYYNIFDETIDFPPGSYDSTFQPAKLYALLREDTVKQQVFIYDNAENKVPEEYLLYDFSLEVGDSLMTYIFDRGPYPGNNQGAMQVLPAVVSKIEQITTADGISRRAFTFDTQFFNPVNIIEGIGCTDFLGALINPFYVPGVSNSDYHESFICMKQDNQLVYGTCYDVSSVSETSAKKYLNLFPNPSNGVFQLTNARVGEMLFIVNAQGQQVHRQLIGSPTEKIDIKGLSTGIYFLRTDGGSTGNLLINEY